MSKVFYNTISELGNAFGVNLELPEHINSDTQWLCYVATCRTGLEYVREWKIIDKCVYYNQGRGWFEDACDVSNERELYKSDINDYSGYSFKYVRVNNQVIKGVSDELLGCEFWEQSTGGSNFVTAVDLDDEGVYVINQYGFSTYLTDAKFYLNDYDDSIVGYDEFVSETYLND